MKVNNYMELKKKEIISFVGAGGKTTMMFKLAEELRLNNKVLVTTTTKIFIPLDNKYDFICTDSESLPRYMAMQENGIYVLGLGVNKDKKILGLSKSELDKLAPHFDYTLIEADGAKEKQLKAWNEFEPVIYEKTTKTIGIMDIQSLGIIINEDNIHRSEIFCELTGTHEGDTVKLEHLSKLILHPRGLFKSAIGDKILYINKVEGPNDLILAKSLVKQVNLVNKQLLNSVIIGSLKTDVYYSKV
ncbi:putative selenium-dependent hydroxylase accessory protein YqeC [Clostridium estertheticum]|uniref:selenium cofactor biosynthesis protein YqeC n=1 Tax=Clostridium estertheticum TaxID=238834 RepID=UPI0013E8FE64|nr:selenium cofactor biosynthesis protein YqeC [Clostridium estertheticum]MBZ9685370.1 putative selenium-dependent hydroxylase accessory protein YqeC [Clostridium estertheticum]